MKLAQSGLNSLLELVEYYNLDPRATAIEMNGGIPERDDWPNIGLSESDRIELIRFVGGG